MTWLVIWVLYIPENRRRKLEEERLNSLKKEEEDLNKKKVEKQRKSKELNQKLELFKKVKEERKKRNQNIENELNDVVDYIVKDHQKKNK